MQKKKGIKVFLFLAVGVLLLLALCFQFAKTGSWFKQSYTLELQSENIGGIRPGADVLMAGIRIGEVKDIALGEEGLKGIIRVNILEEYKIRKDAIFSLQQAGFLGEQHIAVKAVGTTADYLKGGDVVECKAPFSISEVASSATKLMGTLEAASDQLVTIMTRLNTNFLTDDSLKDMSTIVEKAKDTIVQVNSIINDFSKTPLSENGVPKLVKDMDSTVVDLGKAVQEIKDSILSNRGNLDQVLANLTQASEKLNTAMDSLNKTEGLVGSLLNDPEIKTQFQTTVSNLNILVDGLKKYGVISYYRKTKDLRAEEDEK